MSTPVLQPKVYAIEPWLSSLDFVGIECYFQVSVVLASLLPSCPRTAAQRSTVAALQPFGNTSAHPALPWEDISLAQLIAATQLEMAPLAAFSAAHGDKPLVCTEGGSPSRPWAYMTWGGAVELDGASVRQKISVSCGSFPVSPP